MKKAVIYARFSCSAQTEQSIEGQLHVCKDYAKKNDITIVKEFIDRAKSGTTDARPSFQKMIKESQKQHWDYILVYKLDRFSRDKYDSAHYKRILKNLNIKVLSATENIPDTPEAIIFESVLEGFAEYYSAELRQKVKRGMKECYLKGQYTGGSAILYGYDVVNKKVVINKEESQIIKEIFLKFSQSYPATQIAEELNARGYKTKQGKPFTDRFVYKTISNSKYFGIVEHDGVIYNNIYPKLIDDAVWKMVQSIHSKNRKQQGNNKPTLNYILTGKLYCGNCKTKMSGCTSTGRHGHRARYYTCRESKGHKDVCANRYVRKEWLEKTVLKNLYAILLDNNKIHRLAELICDYQREQAKNNELLNGLIAKRKELQKQTDNIMDAILAGIKTKQIEDKAKELESQIASIDVYIELEKDKKHANIEPEEIEDFLRTDAINDLFDNADLQRLIIQNYTNNIILFNDYLVINCNFTMHTRTDDLTPKNIDEIEKILNSDDIKKCYTTEAQDFLAGSPKGS